MSNAAHPALIAREQFMLAALDQARRSFAAGGPPVGACLVQNGSVVARAANAVVAEMDITAHAEMMLLRNHCRDTRSLNLADYDLYVTVEPCLMCFSASQYAGIKHIYFGAPISAMHRYTGSEISLDSMKPRSGGPSLHGGILEAECIALVDKWGRLQPGAGQGLER